MRPRLSLVAALLWAAPALGQTVAIDTTQRFQTIDGFGTCLSGQEAQQAWWQQLYFDDLRASMVRMDITPSFAATYSALSYCSPWFGQAAPLSLDNNANGPDGSRTRRYTGAADYSTSFAGCVAPIAVMGPDIDQNQQFFDFTGPAVAGQVAQLGLQKAAALGDFKLYASLWSPAPWLKISSGNTYAGGAWPLPTAVPWPFIWGGNFAGGKLDTSGQPVAQFTDSTGAATSALTQFARSLAAYLHGFQKTYGVKFYAISIQNELTFEEFYNSMTYPLTADYLAALKAARAELDAHADLAGIKILGPEDLMGGDPYSLWQYGSGATEVDKNLHFLTDVAADATASAALAGFNIHGYASDGVSAAGASASQWSAWANGWQASPAAGIPANVAGFASYGKPSWMTETSGERPEWLAASTSGGFPDLGAFSIAVKIEQALTAGQESGWLYWQLTDGKASNDQDVQTLTDATQLASAPKYNAVKHFFRYIRPGAQRVAATVSGGGNVLASAYVLDSAAALTVVLINEAAAATQVSLQLPAQPAGITSYQVFTSSDGQYWIPTSAEPVGSSLGVSVPAYGVVTLYGAAGGASDGGVDAGSPADAGVAQDAGQASDGGAADGGELVEGGAHPDGGAGGASTSGGSGSAHAVGSCGCASGGRLAHDLSDLTLLAAGLVWRRRRRTLGGRSLIVSTAPLQAVTVPPAQGSSLPRSL